MNIKVFIEHILSEEQLCFGCLISLRTNQIMWANGKWVFLILMRPVPSNHYPKFPSVFIQLLENLVSIRGEDFNVHRELVVNKWVPKGRGYDELRCAIPVRAYCSTPAACCLAKPPGSLPFNTSHHGATDSARSHVCVPQTLIFPGISGAQLQFSPLIPEGKL